MENLVILFILTSHMTLGDTGKLTGVWLEELSTPYYILEDAGYKVEFASISGGVVPIDPNSKKDLGQNTPSVDSFLKDKEAMAAIQSTPAIHQINADRYAGIFIPGGHGTMWDLPNNEKLSSMISKALSDGRVVAAVCHGPAGLIGAKNSKGEPVVKGRKVAAFTNSEEKALDLTSVVPFLLETRLRELGAQIESAPNFEPLAVAHENLITGQNPASSAQVAHLVIEYLKQQKKT